MTYKSALSCCLLAVLALPPAQAEGQSFSDKAARTAQRTGEVAEEGIQKGASAANKGVTKAFETVNEKVFKPADGWIQQKVNPQGKTADKK